MIKEKINTKRKIYGGKQYWVYYDDKGKRFSWSRVSGSGFRKKEDADKHFKDYKTFKKDEIKFTKFKQTKKLIEAEVNKDGRIISKSLRVPKARTQYVVEGYVNGKLVAGRSQILYSGFTMDKQTAINEAWKNFYARINVVVLGKKSDEDEGLKYIEKNVNKIKNVKEGWVIYNKIKQTKLKDVR